MAFQVTFFTFSKRQNSTARPSGNGHPYNCTGKEPLNVTAPRLQLQLANGAQANPSEWNYAYISAFGRYYWVTNWTNEGPIWTAALSVDALASWKTDIGTNRAYIYRSAYSYDLKIADTMYPSKAQRHILNVSLPKPFTIGGASASGEPADNGIIVLGIIGNGATNYYGFTPAQLSDFMAYLFSQTYYDTVLTEFGAVEYPEAKVAINPMQYISSAKFIPMGVSTPTLGGFQPWTLHAGTITGINVGTVLLQQQTAYAFFQISGTPIKYHTTTSYIDFTVTEDFLHPQADDRGDWLNMAPHTVYELFYPPFGIVQLDPAALSTCEVFRIRLTIDVWAASGILEVITDPGTTAERTILRLSSTVGADIPLSNIQTLGQSTLELAQHEASALTAAWNMDAGGVMASARAVVRTMVDGWIPHLSTMGSQGSTAQMEGQPRLMVTHWLMANDDLNGQGRPLCSVRQISTIPGYIKADADELAVPCTASELAEIRTAVAGGFYYE